MKKIEVFYIFLFLVLCFTGCKKKQINNDNNVVTTLEINKYKFAKQNFKNILNGFIKKHVDVLYSVLGEPDEKQTTFSNNTWTLTYRYVFNFAKNFYDCEVMFFVDKDNNIVKYNISSDSCYMITMY